jgi:hypothetical protein
VNVRARDLAPPGARNVFVHSISVFLTTSSANDPVYLEYRGRYPGWDTPGTTIYNQPFTSTNSLWLEIIHEFPLGIECVEAYGRRLLPSRYSTFDDKMLLSYTYLLPGKPGVNTQKLLPVHWGTYLPRYSPRVRPKH